MRSFSIAMRAALLLLVSSVAAFAQISPTNQTPRPQFAVTSSTFQNETALPPSTLFNNISNGVNTCSADGAPGGNASPQLTWTPVQNARTYAVLIFDQTASFTHWGLYNIAPSVTSLAAGTGVAGTSYGIQITNDFGNPEYDGPCPPPGTTHQYVVTVYALDGPINLPQTPGFANYSEALYRAMIGHVLAQTSITGLSNSTP